MKHVVGKGKKSIERISKESSTVVEIYKYNDGNIQKEAVRLTGREAGCSKAIEMIHQIIKDPKFKERPGMSNQNPSWRSSGGIPPGHVDHDQVCSYYLDGKCNRDSSCPYKHSDQPRPKMIKLE